ncbi:MAG: GGDEF domain-containing protein, partial [Acidobacteriota bacterium]|nr:GGDEF domain-containing protein [Acidobacteriota bacterium]
MDLVPLSPQVSKQIESVLAGDSPDGGTPWAALRALASTHGSGVYSEVVERLVHIELGGEAAASFLDRIAVHQADLAAGLGRDPGFMIAVADFSTNIEPVLKNPAVVETEFLRRIERSAVTDSLTSLFNRRYLDRALRIEMRRSERYRRDTSLLMLDLDRFKEINDRRGHRFGDRVLTTVGSVMARAVREADVACR